MALYHGSTKTHAVLNTHYTSDTAFHYTTSTGGSTFLSMTFTTHTTASKHIVFATVNGSANDDASGVLEYYNNGSWQQRDEMRGASGPGGGGNFRGSFGDWSVSRASAMEDKQTCQWTAIYEFDFPSTNSGYRVRYTCENTGGLYLNRPRGSDGGYNTNTSRSSLFVLELGD